MAGGFLRTMSKLGLVELEGAEQSKVDADSKVDMAEIDRLLAEEEKKQKPKAQPRRGPAPAPAPALTKEPPRTGAPTLRAPAGDIAEGRPFDDYYGDGGVGPGPYPAEKLLKVLDGLRQMDVHTRKAAVTAMDAADDGWSIADVVLDAQRKQRVLEDTKVQLAHQADAVRAEVEQRKAQMTEYLKKATETIQEKIRQLEAQLAQEAATISTQRVELDARAAAAAEACHRETRRLQGEIDRLSEITNTFIVDRPAGG